jgi:beta-xylosidase
MILPRITSFLIILLVAFFANLKAQQLQSDNDDGTFTNPVIYSYCPDIDVIRVDSVYYLVSTSMFVFPGVTILKAFDLYETIRSSNYCLQ